MNCANHEQSPAIGVCTACGRALCSDCAIHWQGRLTCKPCLEGSANDPAAATTPRKSPTLAGLLSLLPGLGQAYVGYYLIGFIYIFVTGATIAALEGNALDRSGEPFLGLFLTFFWIFNIIDAVRRANQYNRHFAGAPEVQAPTDSPLVGGIILLVLGLLMTLDVTLGIELDFLETTWPLGLLAVAAYLFWRYRKTRRALQQGEGMPAQDQAVRDLDERG
jgi:hypothetical protein